MNEFRDTSTRPSAIKNLDRSTQLCVPRAFRLLSGLSSLRFNLEPLCGSSNARRFRAVGPCGLMGTINVLDTVAGRLVENVGRCQRMNGPSGRRLSVVAWL